MNREKLLVLEQTTIVMRLDSEGDMELYGEVLFPGEGRSALYFLHGVPQSPRRPPAGFWRCEYRGLLKKRGEKTDQNRSLIRSRALSSLFFMAERLVNK